MYTIMDIHQIGYVVSNHQNCLKEAILTISLNLFLEIDFTTCFNYLRYMTILSKGNIIIDSGDRLN